MKTPANKGKKAVNKKQTAKDKQMTKGEKNPDQFDEWGTTKPGYQLNDGDTKSRLLSLIRHFFMIP